MWFLSAQSYDVKNVKLLIETLKRKKIMWKICICNTQLTKALMLTLTKFAKEWTFTKLALKFSSCGTPLII